MKILSKEAGSGSGFYTPPVFPGNILLLVIFNYSKNWFRKRKLTHCLQICIEINFGSDIAIPTASVQVTTPTMAQPLAMSIVVSISVSPREKPENFNGLNFKMWQQNMLFYLTTLNLVRFFTEYAPKLKEDERDIQVISVVNA